MSPSPPRPPAALSAVPGGTVLASGDTVGSYEALHCWACFRTYVPSCAISRAHDHEEQAKPVEFWITTVRANPTGPSSGTAC